MKENLHKGDYSNYTASDFALDDQFVSWVKSQDYEVADFWEKWSDQNPEKVKELEAAKVMVLALSFDEEAGSQEETNLVWNALQNQKRGRSVQQSRSERKSSSLRFWFQLAASLVLITSVGFGISHIYNIGQEEVYFEKVTQKGQKLLIVLPDGSEVLLNAESALKYPQKFDEDQRIVSLKGEGYFRVKSSLHYPFVVNTSHVSTSAAGTSFNVRAYPDETHVQVALIEGSVSVSRVDQVDTLSKISLKPSEMITVNTERKDGYVSSFNLENVGWKDGYLCFRKASFQQLIKELERWYGVEFVMEEQAGLNPDWRFSGQFKDKSLSYILKVVSYPDVFSYRIKNETVYINNY